ncbi:hypothetical protein B5X24_HaOG213647 [Helicoverpa armigera]|nr:hypothetical protein B5X24_HaOG213647 [Helicoverpa armigera]
MKHANLRNAHESSALKSSKSNKETWGIIKNITKQEGKKFTANKLLAATDGEDAPNSIEHINQYFSSIGKQLAEKIVKNQTPALAPYPIQTLPARDSMVLLSPDEAEVEAVINNLKNDCATGWDSIPVKLLKLGKETQFGFRPKKSTTDAVNQLADYVTGKLDEKQKCLGVFLDLAKAFDTVCVPTLVTKLEHAGIRGKALSMFSDFLSNRTQKVKIGEVISKETGIEYGVPQGSCLSPSLFLIYVNDLCQQKLTNGKIFSYADDTVLVFHGARWDDARMAAETGLSKVIHWLEANLLTLNIQKTSFLQFSFAKIRPTAIDLKAHSCDNANFSTPCSCLPISQQKTIKYLGVILDERLSWRPHIEQTSSRVRKLIWAFKKVRQVAEFQLLRSIYQALAQSIISYCITAWGGACKSYMISLERAQRSLLKHDQMQDRLGSSAAAIPIHICVQQG